MRFTNIDIIATSSGAEYIGGLVGQTAGATIQDVSVTGSVEGSSVVGGLVGSLEADSTVSRSSFTGLVTDIMSYGGGFAGFIYDSSGYDSYANATYSGVNVGGGDLDMDLEENGEFEDPVGLAEGVIGSPNTGIKRL